MTTFSEWLSERLKNRGLSVRQFALQVGVSPEGAGYWAKGERMPMRRYHASIARTLGISEAEFARAWTEFKTEAVQVHTLKPGDEIELFRPGGKRVRVTQRLLNVVDAASDDTPEPALAAQAE